VDLVKIRRWWIGGDRELGENQSYDHHLGAFFACTCWQGSKISRQYGKFQKRSPEKASRGLGENGGSGGRGLDENQTIWIKPLKKRTL
jgi:hypothetical protein